MMCYRDRTWCNFDKCKKYHPEKCSRVLSEYDNKRIEDGQLPVCFYGDKPKCYEEK